jgi:2-polyprenyl-3-methyl-5-hydroxy-6-metoxy-1,4-benzoquinol methylase
MTVEDIKTCPICESTDLEPFLHTKDYANTSETFSIVGCKNCKLGITTPRPDHSSISRYYQSENYISHTGGKKNLTDFLYRQARALALIKKKNTIAKFSTTGTLLDYGCGTGEFLQFMKRNSWQTFGIEPSDAARAKAVSTNGQIIFPSLQQLPPQQKFDAVTLWHVAEHLHQLNETIADIKTRLTPNGVLLLAVPNYQSPDAKHYKCHWAGYDVPRHLWHFGKHAMQLLLQKHGMNLASILPMTFDAYYISIVSESYQAADRSKLLNLTKGLHRGLLSNLQAKKEMNYSSLLYIAHL